MMTHKLGRLPRAFDKRIPQMKKLMEGRELDLPPPTVDYTIGLPSNLGMMLNDQLGDCTCAAVGHSQQVWTYNVSKNMVTPTDDEIEELYEAACGYVPGDPSTDNGGIEQAVLSYWLNNPVDDNEISAYIELDPTNLIDVRRGIWECGVVYIGFNVPAYLMNSLTSPGSVWDVEPNGNNNSVGGHAVILSGYETNGNMKLISWGSVYTMTPAFWAANVDECYALIDKDWIASTGSTPAGLNISQLEALMNELKFIPSGSGGGSQHRHHRRQMRKRRAK